ncbi:MAG: hypothetical protein ABSH41_14835 [Syntrophobacteraceae bacterium]|jgi:hypothetical protein
MNVAGHDYKADASSAGFLQFIGKKVNDNALCAIIIKDSEKSLINPSGKI